MWFEKWSSEYWEQWLVIDTDKKFEKENEKKKIERKKERKKEKREKRREKREEKRGKKRKKTATEEKSFCHFTGLID